jgi:Arm DNA-binding domain
MVARLPQMTATLRHPATLSVMHVLPAARIYASWDDDWRVSCMVNRLRLNEKSVREAEPAKGRDYQIFDADVRGFAVCIYRSGSRTFTIDYRHAWRQRRMNIGRWPEWSVTAARERAKELRRAIDDAIVVRELDEALQFAAVALSPNG